MPRAKAEKAIEQPIKKTIEPGRVKKGDLMALIHFVKVRDVTGRLPG